MSKPTVLIPNNFAKYRVKCERRLLDKGLYVVNNTNMSLPRTKYKEYLCVSHIMFTSCLNQFCLNLISTW
jgi:hypothetical protein